MGVHCIPILEASESKSGMEIEFLGFQNSRLFPGFPTCQEWKKSKATKVTYGKNTSKALLLLHLLIYHIFFLTGALILGGEADEISCVWGIARDYQPRRSSYPHKLKQFAMCVKLSFTPGFERLDVVAYEHEQMDITDICRLYYEW